MIEHEMLQGYEVFSRDDGLSVVRNPGSGNFCLISGEERFLYDKLKDGAAIRDILVSKVFEKSSSPLTQTAALIEKIKSLENKTAGIPISESSKFIPSLPIKISKLGIVGITQKVFSNNFLSAFYVFIILIFTSYLLINKFENVFTTNGVSGIPLYCLFTYVIGSLSLTLASLSASSLGANRNKQYSGQSVPCRYRFFFGVIYLEWDTSLCHSLSRDERIASWMTGVMFIMTGILISSIHGYMTGDFGMLYLFSFFGLFVLRPFSKSYVHYLLEEVLKIPGLVKSASAYTKNRMFKNIMKTSYMSVYEPKIIIYLSVYIVWFYVLIQLISNLLIPRLYHSAIAGFSDYSIVSICFSALIITVTLISFFWAFIKTIFFLTTIFRPLAKVLKKGGKFADLSYAEFIKAVPIFSNLTDSEIKDIIKDCVVSNYKRGEKIVSQGEKGDKFFIIISGQVDVVIEDELGSETRVATLNAKDGFGEIALLDDRPRTATCCAVTNVKVLSVSGEAFLKFTKKNVNTSKRIEEILRTSESLRKNTLFKELSGKTISKIIFKSEINNYKKSDVIIKEGDDPDSLYLIKKGTVAVESSGKKLTDLGEGDFFGEIALLKNKKRNATVIADTECSILSLSSKNFWEIINGDVVLGAIFENVSDSRLGEQSC